MTNTRKILSLTIALLLLTGLYLAVDYRGKNKEVVNLDKNLNSTSTGASSISMSDTSVIKTNNGSYTIERVPIVQNIKPKVPDLSAPILVTNPSLVGDSKTAFLAKIDSLRADLRKTPSDFDKWILLGTQEKYAGDYQAAVASWTYASQIAPSDHISFGNLADLYAYFLHDPVSAEKNYIKAITNSPTQAYLYVQFAEMCRDILKDNTKALSIVKDGLKNIPIDENLLRLEKSLGQN